MSGTFADAARQLAGATAIALGWRPHEFWGTTPAELAAIINGARRAGDTPLTREDLDTLMERERDG